MAASLISLCVIVGALASAAFVNPGDWYEALPKPSFNPPAWVFGPVWTVISILTAISALLIWKTEKAERTRAMVLFGLLGFWNIVWCLVFFTLHNIGLGFAVLVLLWLTLAAVIGFSWGLSKAAALTLAPFLFWVTFAGILNLSIWYAFSK